MQNINEDAANDGMNNDGRRQPRIFYGWWVVVAACILGMFGNGSISQGFPRFFTPIQQSIGLNEAQMGLVFSLARAEGSIAGPAIGWLVDRIGARPMVFVGCIVVGVSVILMSRANSYWMLLVLFSGFVSMGKSAGFGQTLMAAVNQWFIRRRHIALSTLMTAFAGGGAIVVPLLNESIQWIGWRDTLVWTGIIILALTIPISFVIRSRPEDMGLRPDGDPPMAESPSREERQRRSSANQEVNFTFRQAIRTRTYWVFMIGAILRVSVTNGMLVFIFPIMALNGLSEDQASAWVSAMFFLGIPLRFVLGVTAGKFRSNIILAVGMACGAVGMWGLWLGPGVLGLLSFVVGIAIVEGVTSVNWLMLSDYYGRGRFATLMGFMSLFMNVGMFATPLITGWVKVATGNYDLVLAAFTPMYLISALAFLFCTRPPPPAGSRRRWVGREAEVAATKIAPAPDATGDGD